VKRAGKEKSRKREARRKSRKESEELKKKGFQK
jgi:hypothetical protein